MKVCAECATRVLLWRESDISKSLAKSRARRKAITMRFDCSDTSLTVLRVCSFLGAHRRDGMRGNDDGGGKVDCMLKRGKVDGKEAGNLRSKRFCWCCPSEGRKFLVICAGRPGRDVTCWTDGKAEFQTDDNNTSWIDRTSVDLSFSHHTEKGTFNVDQGSPRR